VKCGGRAHRQLVEKNDATAESISVLQRLLAAAELNSTTYLCLPQFDCARQKKFL
jgi:hypothetical protein